MNRADIEQIAGVLSLHRPKAPVQTLPLLFDSPHSGTEFPQDFRTSLEPELILRTGDLFVNQLFEPVVDAGATLLEASFPRAYIDVNRAIDDLDDALIEPGFELPLHPTEKSRLGKGLIWRVAAGGRAIYDRRLSAAAITARIEQYYQPYHRCLRMTLDTLHEQFGEVWHVNCHSMKSISNEMDAEGSGIPRADIVLSDREGRSAERDYVEGVRELLQREGFKVALNDPFKGAEVLRRHGRPAEGRHAIQIEINRALYMDERTLQTHAGFDQLKSVMARLSLWLADYCRSRN